MRAFTTILYYLYSTQLLLLTCPLVVSSNDKVDLASLERSLFQQGHLPLILVEGLTILEKHFDFSPCLPLTMNTEGCLLSKPQCRLPALNLSAAFSFPMKGSFQICPHNRTITAFLSISDTMIETRPIQFDVHYNSSHKIATVSANLFVKVSGRNALRLLFGSFKINASFNVKIHLKRWPLLHYKLKLDYDVQQKKVFAKKYRCVACQQKWRRHGTWSVSSLLQTIAAATGN